MDRIIVRYNSVDDRDLMLCYHRGVAYQKDMKVTAKYDEDYYNKCRGYEGQEIARKINAARAALVSRHAGADSKVLDVGVGSGEFIKTRPNTFGYDVNPAAAAWLQEYGFWCDDFSEFRAFTFWDVIEHIEDPHLVFRNIPNGSFLFTSLPIFDDLDHIRDSKHYRPGEHLYYWTKDGFTDWMSRYRFELLESNDDETVAGRDSIVSFAFRKTLPGYHDTLAQYQEIHSHFYGASAHLYLDTIAGLVKELDPRSILDFGCGRSDLAAHFWRDGKRRIARYDPAINEHKTFPDGTFDLVICCDVMEHILMEDVDRIFERIREKSQNVIFTISLRPARAKLPDGRNAHVTLLDANEWLRWIDSVFKKAIRVPVQWDHILMVKTWKR